MDNREECTNETYGKVFSPAAKTVSDTEKTGFYPKLKKIEHDFTVCKIADIKEFDSRRDFCFVAKTDEEISLVCITEDTPDKTLEREDGWKAFRIQGILDFSLIGILSKISGILADNKIGIFAVSTFNTDYIFVKRENFDEALKILAEAGYSVI